MKKDARSLSHKSKAELRLLAVKAVIEQGKKQIEVAKMFSVTKQIVSRWIQEYKRGGYKSLEAKKKGRPDESGSKLKAHQVAIIVKLITDKTPDQLKFPFVLWTREAVSEVIRCKFGVKLSRWSIGRLLKRWGFTPQKPMKRSCFQDPKKVQEWTEVKYPEIAKLAKHQDAEIQWLDEMGARSDDQVGRTYSLKGVTPVIPVSGIRFSCNFISTITTLGKLRFMAFKDKFTADVFLKFLKRLVSDADKKIFLLIDSHSVHRAKKIQAWLSKNKNKIEFFFLPPYSPELNPVEYLNQDVKTNTIRKQKSINQKEMIKNVAGYLKKRQRTPDKVRNYFNAEKTKYASWKVKL